LDDYHAFGATDGVATLRAWTADDAPFIVDASTDPSIRRYSTPHDHDGHPAPLPTFDDATATIEAFAARWQASRATGTVSGVGFAICDAANDGVVGQCGIDEWTNDIAQVGYWLARGARGRGFATRAVVILTAWLFAHGSSRVFMTIVADNQTSIAVARRAGFAHEATLRGDDAWLGQTFDVLRFAASARDWLPPIEGTRGV
jgi:RimJ/RimL family protein N-acetyltransferase